VSGSGVYATASWRKTPRCAGYFRGNYRRHLLRSLHRGRNGRERLCAGPMKMLGANRAFRKEPRYSAKVWLHEEGENSRRAGTYSALSTSSRRDSEGHRDLGEYKKAAG
jgi:hypothetical protein